MKKPDDKHVAELYRWLQQRFPDHPGEAVFTMVQYTATLAGLMAHHNTKDFSLDLLRNKFTDAFREACDERKRLISMISREGKEDK